MAECLFCRIAEKKIPANIVHESDLAMAFRDIHPKAPVHVLVIPKEHLSGLQDLKPGHGELLNAIHQAIREVAKQEKIDATGFRVIVNNGPDSGQEVAHVHYHVLGGRRLGPMIGTSNL